MKGAQLTNKNPSVCSCDGSSVLSPQLRSRSTYRKNEPTGSCEVTEHPPFGGWFLKSFLDRPYQAERPLLAALRAAQVKETVSVIVTESENQRLV